MTLGDRSLTTCWVTAHSFGSITLSAVSPGSVPHALSRRTCGLTGGGSPMEGVQVCACRVLTDGRTGLQVTFTSDQCALTSSPSLAASSFSFLASFSAAARPPPWVPCPSPWQTSDPVRRSYQETEVGVRHKELKRYANCL